MRLKKRVHPSSLPLSDRRRKQSGVGALLALRLQFVAGTNGLGKVFFVTQPNSTVDPEGISPRKRGLLLSPRFPADSFWSYRHVMRMIDRKTAFPPLGLLTFAAEMPSQWDFTLMDLNVGEPGDGELRRAIEDADAVFVGAMSIQKRSLVEILNGPARGLDTPFVLGGPFPSTYRDQILNPANDSDRSLYEGLDLLVWGEGAQWIDEIELFLRENPGHSSGQPRLLIPPEVLGHAAGSRKYLNDRTIFKPLGEAPPPRWDLIRPADYRSLMIQTTLGCPFRCDFCDIIDFNGGFTRVKTTDGVRRELEALYETGHRGGVFTVDDNFIGNPKEITRLLDVMTQFQRERGYPFRFYTQASVNLGTPSLEHLIGKMRRAGFVAVFLGIENPDPAALNVMNKKQNKMVDIPATVSKIQKAGIEVFAGFIFGNDTDTLDTAEEIVGFVQSTGIVSAMTGMLTPTPHTPLYEELRQQGRLIDVEFTGNNTDDDVQFLPERMSPEEMRRGMHRILESLFNPGEIYRRAGDMLGRMQQHIFTSGVVESAEVKAAVRSVWQQGIRRIDPRFFRLLLRGMVLDRRMARRAAAEKRELDRLERSSGRSSSTRLSPTMVETLSRLVEYSHDYLVRFRPELGLQQVADFTRDVGRRLQSGVISSQELRTLLEGAGGFLEAQIAQYRFPGRYLSHAFELAIMGSHYRQVMRAIVGRDTQPAPERLPLPMTSPASV
jgi:radical SAM superfamily enzyme YgiQ (UPF0313 family)